MQPTIEEQIDQWQRLLERQIDCIKQGKAEQAQATAVKTSSFLERFTVTEKIRLNFKSRLLEIKKLYEKLMMITKSDMADVKGRLCKLRKNARLLRAYRSGLGK